MKNKWTLMGVVVLAVIAGGAHATDYYWTGADNQSWDHPGNWNPNGVPGAVDRALIYSNLEQGGVRAGTGVQTITVGELICNNNAGLGFADGSTIIIDSSQGQSGDLTYFGTYWGIEPPGDQDMTFDIDGAVYVQNTFWWQWGSNNTWIIRGDNKPMVMDVRNFGTTAVKTLEIYGSYCDNGSDFGSISGAEIVVKAGGQILPNPNTGTEWTARSFNFEGGQSNMPAYGSNVNFRYGVMRGDNNAGNWLAVTGGVMYPQDVTIGVGYWGGGASRQIGDYRFRTKDGDLGIARDLVMRSTGNWSMYTGDCIYDTADNDGGAAHDVTIGRDLMVDTTPYGETIPISPGGSAWKDNTKRHGIILNDSTVRVGRDFQMGAMSTSYYNWQPRNWTNVDLGSAMIYIGDDLLIHRRNVGGLDNGSTADDSVWHPHTSTIIFDGNGTGGTGDPPWDDAMSLRSWSDTPLHNVWVDTGGAGTVELDDYEFDPGNTWGFNDNTALVLTGDLLIKSGTFDQNQVPIIFNGPEHHLQVDNVILNPLDQIELLADAVVLLDSDIVMGDLTMGSLSKMYLQDFELFIVSDNTSYSGTGQWAYGDGTIFGGGLVIPGDSNGDGKIDGGDLAIWQQNYDPLGTGNNTFALGDWNNDGKIDGGDLALWQQNYDPIGPTGADGMGANVPEPATLLLLGTGVLGAIGAIRRRRVK